MAPKSIKLTYFNVRGRGDHIRLILNHAGIEFEDIRVEFDKWPAMKPTTPWGSLPFLTVDGKTLGQSIAVSRYAARLAGIAGDSAAEQARLDSVVDACTDLREKLIKAKEDEAKKKLEDDVPSYLEKLEKILGNNEYFGGKKISWADIHLFSVYESYEGAGFGKLFTAKKSIAAIVEGVRDSPNIKAYIAKRPKTNL